MQRAKILAFAQSLIVGLGCLHSTASWPGSITLTGPRQMVKNCTHAFRRSNVPMTGYGGPCFGRHCNILGAWAIQPRTCTWTRADALMRRMHAL